MRCKERTKLNCPGSGIYDAESGEFIPKGIHRHAPLPDVELDEIRTKSILRQAAVDDMHAPLRELFDKVV